MKKIVLLFLLVSVGIAFAYFIHNPVNVSDSKSERLFPMVEVTNAKHSSSHDKSDGEQKQQLNNLDSHSGYSNSAKALQFTEKDRRDTNKRMSNTKEQREIISSYKNLLAGLKLPEDKLKLFKELVVEYDFLPDNTFLDLSLNGKDMPTRALVQDQIEANKKELMENFKGLLTDDQFEFFQYYMKTRLWRGDASRLANDMQKNTGEKLTPENRESFVGLMSDALETIRTSSHGFSNVTDAEVEDYVRQYIKKNNGTILTPAQLDYAVNHYRK